MNGARPDELATDHDPLIGRVIAGKFKIVRRLGAGAMGAVYRAEQTALERSVAIKVMHGGIAADPTYAARFHLEAKAASRLDHPNLIRVLDYGQERDGLLYIAMEYLECRDLFTVLAEDWPLTHERIVDILSQTLSGLAEAHESGVLHRDLKPENIMIVRRKGDEGGAVEIVKVGDFGIAKLVEPSAGGEAATREGRKLTSAGLVVGTPEYMSPEQARGESFDRRSDVYAVGVILYQMLTRRLPFQGKNSIEVVFKAMNEEPAKLGSDGMTAAPGLDPVCVKAMSKRPDDRFQDAREMRAALRAAPRVSPAAIDEAGSGARISQRSTEADLRPAPEGSRGVSRGALAGGTALLVATAIVAASIALRPARQTTTVASASAAEPAVPSPSVREEPVTRPEPPASEPPASSATTTTARPQATGSSGARSVRSRVVPASDPSTQATVDPPSVPVASSSSVAATPSPGSAPTASVVAAPTPPSPPPQAVPSFNAATARIDLGQARSNNAAAASSSVSRALAPLAGRFTACFRTALAQSGAGVPARESAGTLHLESDDQGYVTVAQVSGAPVAGAARCIEALCHDVHIQVDTGTANADVTLTFEPQ